MHSIAINLPGLHPGYERVPIVVRAVNSWIQLDRPARSAIFHPVEKQQLHARSGTGKNAEVCTAVPQCGAQRMAKAYGEVRIHSRVLFKIRDSLILCAGMDFIVPDLQLTLNGENGNQSYHKPLHK